MLKRWLIYLSEVFLPGSRTLVSLVLAVGIQCLYQAMIGKSPLVLTWDTAPAVMTIVLILLYYRIQDEFKDAETDRKFFPNRPLPSGRVRFSDLKVLMWTTFLLLVVINFTWRLVVLPFLVLFGFALLMHKWFFMEKTISSNRLLAFITHAPVSLIGNYFVLAVYANRFNVPLESLAAITVVVWFALPSLAWEIARKTRAPFEEMSGYQTYSALIGSTNAVMLSIVFVLLQCGIALFLPASKVYLGLLIAITIGYVAWFIRFASNPALGSKSLRPVAELYGLISTVGLIADLVVTRGILWSRLVS